jgi:hypothetical protein
MIRRSFAASRRAWALRRREIRKGLLVPFELAALIVFTIFSETVVVILGNLSLYFEGMRRPWPAAIIRSTAFRIHFAISCLEAASNVFSASRISSGVFALRVIRHMIGGSEWVLATGPVSTASLPISALVS